jgi:hypothetical protein
MRNENSLKDDVPCTDDKVNMFSTVDTKQKENSFEKCVFV